LPYVRDNHVLDVLYCEFAEVKAPCRSVNGIRYTLQELDVWVSWQSTLSPLTWKALLQDDSRSSLWWIDSMSEAAPTGNTCFARLEWTSLSAAAFNWHVLSFL